MKRLLLPMLIAASTAIAAETAAVRVNGVAIPQARLDTAVREAVAAGSPDSAELRAVVRAQLVAGELFRQEAARRRMQDDPQVLEARDAAMIQRYLREAIRPEPVPEETVRARYDAIVAGLGEREYRGRLIAVAEEPKARELLAMLKAGHADFADLARQHSLLANHDRGGETGWVSFKTPAVEGRSQGLPPPVADALAALAALPAGSVAAEPIAWQGRHYLARLDEARATHIPAYDEVKASLRRALETQAVERAAAELAKRLLATARIEYPGDGR